jgi:hypothetical protein
MLDRMLRIEAQAGETLEQQAGRDLRLGAGKRRNRGLADAQFRYSLGCSVRAQPGGNQRAAASALSSGTVLNAMAAAGAALCTALTTPSNSASP